MTGGPAFLLTLALIFPALANSALAQDQAQMPSPDSVSSDDISIADGLQLPAYGHIWALDSWKGVKELVQLRRPEDVAA